MSHVRMWGLDRVVQGVCEWNTATQAPPKLGVSEVWTGQFHSSRPQKDMFMWCSGCQSETAMKTLYHTTRTHTHSRSHVRTNSYWTSNASMQHKRPAASGSRWSCVDLGRTLGCRQAWVICSSVTTVTGEKRIEGNWACCVCFSVWVCQRFFMTQLYFLCRL